MECGFMVSVSTKMKRTRLLFVLLIVVVSILCMGCDPYYGHYPHNKGLEWVCSNPNFTLSFTYNPNGTFTQEAFLEADGEMIAVEVCFYSIYFEVNPRSSNHYSDRFFTGEWKYRGGNLVLKIDEDFVFDNQYEEFVFSPVNAD